jgi:hypothetical protein
MAGLDAGKGSAVSRWFMVLDLGKALTWIADYTKRLA